MKRSEYCDKNGIFAQSEYIVLRKPTESEKGKYFNLIHNLYGFCIPNIIRENYWDIHESNEDHLSIVIVAKESDAFIGIIELQNLNEDIQELGIDIVEEYRNKGFGYSAVSLFTSILHRKFDVDELVVRINDDNIASKALFNKFDIAEVSFEENAYFEIIKRGVEIIKDIDSDDLFKEFYCVTSERAEIKQIVSKYLLKCKI